MKVQSRVSRNNTSSIYPPAGMQLRAALLPCLMLLLATFFTPGLLLLAQTPPVRPPNTQDGRGLGLPNSPATTTTSTPAQKSGATTTTRPELVLQSGYAVYGATGMRFSPDARLLATWTMNSNGIKLWEVATGRELRALTLDSGNVVSGFGGMTLTGVSAVAFSRDGRLLAAGGRTNTVKIWNVLTGREVQTLAAPNSGGLAASIGVFFLTFTPDAGRLVSLSDAIRTWDVATGSAVQTTELSLISAASSAFSSPFASVPTASNSPD